MGTRKFWLRVLNVYPEEWWIVKRLYMLQFFQGAGIAFFFTSAFAQFLERFEITKLPWAMVISSGLLWLIGYLYARLEHVLPLKTFHISCLLFSTVSMLLFWILALTTGGDWFYYLLISWFSVLYMVDNLAFWGLASLLFDVRQSKRLFAVVSGGDIPAKFVGYTMALILVPYTGTKSLMLIGASCMLISFPFLLGIVKSGKQIAETREEHGKHNHSKSKKVTKIVSNIVTNGYIRRIAIISLITSVCLILFNYGLYGEVANAYNEDVQLASFIAFFYASVRILAFITKMIFTSRVTASLGVKAALFITPTAMIILTGAIIGVSRFSSDHKLIFYMFGVASILIEVLRTSFNTPVLLTLMQPLPVHDRLKAHNIAKGIMDPFAFLLSGSVLLILFGLHKEVDLLFLCYTLLVLGVFWIIGIVLVNRRYIAILVDTISSRYFSRDEFQLKDEAIMAQIRDKMMKGTELEVISILNMLNSKKIDSIAEDLLIQLLEHPSDRVKIESIHLIASRSVSRGRESLENLMQQHISHTVHCEAVKAYCKIASEEWQVSTYLHHHDAGLREAAISGLLANSRENARREAELELTKLLSSDDDQQKRTGIRILDDVKDHYTHPQLPHLIEQSSPEIREKAIRAIGKASGPETLRGLFKHIGSHEKAALEAFYNAGNKSISIIHEQLTTAKLDDHVQEKLITLVGKTGGDDAIQTLVALLKSRHNIPSIVKALHRCKYNADPDTLKELEAIARRYIVYAVELLHMRKALRKDSREYEVLNNSLHYELQNIQEILLDTFSCMYDREKLSQAKYGLSAKGVGSSANAMEIIELTVKKDLARLFNTIFESTSIEQRCEALHSLFMNGNFAEVDEVINRILSEKPIEYYPWTKAFSLYISRKYSSVDTTLFKKFAASENRLLRETALFAASK
jgi:AAA family ATP:ADP antiporter